MPPRKGKDLDGGPYPQSQIVRRIEELSARRELPEGKQIAGLLDARPNWWTRRRKLDAALAVAEVSILAERLGAPPGWPWLDAHHSRALARGLAVLAEETATDPIDASPETAHPARRQRKGAAK